MRPSSIFAESIKAILARPLWASIVALSAFFGVALPGILETDSYARLSRTWASDMELGSNIYVLSASSGISSSECERLETWTGVLNVGALASGPVATFSQSPRNPFQTAVVSPGYMAVISDRGTTSAGYSVGAAAAKELGVREGSFLSSPELGGAIVARIVDSEDRAGDQVRWVYDVSAEDFASDQCWVKADPLASNAVLSSLRAGFSNGANMEVQSVYKGDFPRAKDEWLQRPTQQAWLVIGLAAFSTAALYSRVRRSELALYQILGFEKVHVAIVAILQVWVLVSVGSSAAIALLFYHVSTLTSPWPGSLLALGLQGSVASAALQLAAGSLCAMGMLAGGVATALRDRG